MVTIILLKNQTKDNVDMKVPFLTTLILTSLFVFIAIPALAKNYTFSWSPNEGNVEGYKLYYKKGGAAEAPFLGEDANEGDSPIIINGDNSITVTGLEDNTTYHFTLTAYSGTDESDFTDIITVYPSDDKQERIAAVLNIINTLLLNSEE